MAVMEVIQNETLIKFYEESALFYALSQSFCRILCLPISLEGNNSNIRYFSQPPETCLNLSGSEFGWSGVSITSLKIAQNKR